jgi:hypothetical protein
LLTRIRDKGEPGVTARFNIGWVMANSSFLLATDKIGYSLDTCFDLVRQAAATMADMEAVRQSLAAELPKTLGGTIVRDRSILLALAQTAKIISGMTFVSRSDVEALIYSIQAPFNSAEEMAADTMDGFDYQAIVRLRSAIVNHLVSTSRPLPSMLVYQFTSSLSSLVISYRLYADARRYDEIRKENKVVHPAFCRSSGRALSQ